MPPITYHDSFDDMLNEIRKQRKRADSLVNPTQAKIKPNQYFINYHHDLGLAVFGRVLDYKTLGIDEKEQEQINLLYNQPHMKNYRPTKAYSVSCPQGELGDIHVASASAIIDKDLFNWYKKNNWVKSKTKK